MEKPGICGTPAVQHRGDLSSKGSGMKCSLCFIGNSGQPGQQNQAMFQKTINNKHNK